MYFFLHFSNSLTTRFTSQNSNIYFIHLKINICPIYVTKFKFIEVINESKSKHVKFSLNYTHNIFASHIYTDCFPCGKDSALIADTLAVL